MTQFYSPEEWLAIVREAAPEAFVTGSRAFGTGRDPVDTADLSSIKKAVSDTDIAVLVSSGGNTREKLSKMFPVSCEDSSYNNGFKFSTVHGTLNIVPLHPLDFVCWKLTTTHMQKIITLCPEARGRISCRETKLGIFEALTGIHKMLIPYKGADDCVELAERIEG